MSSDPNDGPVWPSVVLFLIFVVAVAGVIYLAKADARSGFRKCEAATKVLYKIAWEDPDAFDMQNLFDYGAKQYMCEPPVEYNPVLAVACDLYRRYCP